LPCAQPLESIALLTVPTPAPAIELEPPNYNRRTDFSASAADFDHLGESGDVLSFRVMMGAIRIARTMFLPAQM